MKEIIQIPDRASLLIEGELVRLQPLVRSDASDRYVAWLNDPDTMRHLEYPCGDATIAGVEDYIARYENAADALLLGIYLRDNGVHVGNVKLGPILWNHRRAVTGILIGEPSARGRGVGGEAIRLCLDIAFNILKLHRVELGLTEDNVAAARCYEEAGFVQEGRLRDATRRTDGFVDDLYYSILADEYAARYA